MSRPKKPDQKEEQAMPASADVKKVPTVEEVAARIADHRRCPRCWGACRGVGECYSTVGSTRYYKCARSLKEPNGGGCAFTWTARVRTEVVEISYRTVELRER